DQRDLRTGGASEGLDKAGLVGLTKGRLIDPADLRVVILCFGADVDHHNIVSGFKWSPNAPLHRLGVTRIGTDVSGASRVQLAEPDSLNGWALEHQRHWRLQGNRDPRRGQPAGRGHSRAGSSRDPKVALAASKPRAGARSQAQARRDEAAERLRRAR